MSASVLVAPEEGSGVGVVALGGGDRSNPAPRRVFGNNFSREKKKKKKTRRNLAVKRRPGGTRHSKLGEELLFLRFRCHKFPGPLGLGKFTTFFQGMDHLGEKF